MVHYKDYQQHFLVNDNYTFTFDFHKAPLSEVYPSDAAFLENSLEFKAKDKLHSVEMYSKFQKLPYDHPLYLALTYLLVALIKTPKTLATPNY